MIEIVVGLIYLGVLAILTCLLCKYEKLGLFVLYSVAIVLTLCAAYLIGAVVLGRI